MTGIVASLSNNKSCLELKKTSQKLHFNPGKSFSSVKNSRESNRLLSCIILYIFSFYTKHPVWLIGRSFASHGGGPGFNPPRGNFFDDSFFIKIIFNQSGVQSPLQGVNFFLQFDHFFSYFS